MKSEHKMHNPDDYDKLVCTKIPDPKKYPKLHELVKMHMMHGPCGVLDPSCPCMQGVPKKCHFHYPRKFIDKTSRGEDSNPLYRRRDNGMHVNVCKKDLDNRWVVPYNPNLLMMFNCHMNVEVCTSIKSVKYLFKYIYKGHDKQVIRIDPDEESVVVDKIRNFRDARYVSPPESMWRVFIFALSDIHPPVMALQLHHPNQQNVRFGDKDRLGDVVARERLKRSMFMAFFLRNKIYPSARPILYKDFPRHYTWNSTSHLWNPRKQRGMVGRLVYANPAHGERFYLRLLLVHIAGLTCFEDLYTVNGVLHQTFQTAALERGLIESDDILSKCLEEASLFQFPCALRGLFATILIFCVVGYVRKLWDKHYESLSKDYRHVYESAERVLYLVLSDIKGLLESMGKTFADFDLPRVNANVSTGIFREVQEECSIVVENKDILAQESLNVDQKITYDEIMRHVEYELPGVFFIDGPDGTSKTFLYKALMAIIRACGFIALATTSSGVAANNMLSGRTSHSRFKIPLNLDNNSMCNIKKQSGTTHLLRDAKIIFWDEASMAKRQGVEALDRTMQDITASKVPFGGKIFVMGGDFRQVFPIVRYGSRAQVVNASVRMSPIWSSVVRLRLSVNMRAADDPWFASFLLRVGDGNEETIKESFIRIPYDMMVRYVDKRTCLDSLIDEIFPSLHINGGNSNYIVSMAILSTTNESVDEINAYLIDKFSGEDRVYYSFDEAEDDNNNLYLMEFLNSLTVAGLPPHCLRLKIGCSIMLLRNIDPYNGLCNGTRLICRGFQANVIDAEVAVGQHAGKRVFLPRVPLCPSDDEMFPFRFKRKQFLIRLSFSMTISKAQGQTIPNVGVYLPESVFSHDQLYVALYRGSSRATTKVLVHPTLSFERPGIYTSNVVYKEVLRD